MKHTMPYILAGAAGLILVPTLHNILLGVAPDILQGPVSKIIFIHISAAMMDFTMYFLALLASIGFLITRKFTFDSLGVAAVEVGTMFCALNLATGSVWGRYTWGVWWAWDARMTSQLICFLLYLGYLILRPAIEDPTQRATFSAVLAIFSFADVPIVYFSIQWWRTQHPKPVLSGGGTFPPEWVPGLVFMYIALALLGTALMMVRLQQESSSREIDSLRRQAHAM